MNLIKDFKNELLKRREIEISADYESNPGLKKVTQDIANHFKVSEELIAIKKIISKFGTNEFVVDAFIYNDVKHKEMIEPKKKEKNKEDKK